MNFGRLIYDEKNILKIYDRYFSYYGGAIFTTIIDLFRDKEPIGKTDYIFKFIRYYAVDYSSKDYGQ